MIAEPMKTIELHYPMIQYLKPWPNGPASSRKWTQVELA